MEQEKKLKLKKVVKELVIVASYLIAISVGVYIGYIWKDLHSTKVQTTKAITKKEISIAINEEKQLLLINKVSGEYIIYSDSVGQSIFKMYANQLTQKVTKDQK